MIEESQQSTVVYFPSMVYILLYNSLLYQQGQTLIEHYMDKQNLHF